jgi:hypothetical protein
VGTLGRLAWDMGRGRRGKGRAQGDSGNDHADFGGERAQAEQSAAGRLVRVDRSRVVGVMVSRRPLSGAMLDLIGMSKTVDRPLAVAEGKRRRRHDEAKGRESCKNDREPEAEPGRELCQHRSSNLSFFPAT